MTVDTSAVVGILRNEPDARALAEKLRQANVRRLSAANYLEVAIVIDGERDPIASRRVDEFITASGIVIEPVTEAQAKIAREAYRDFGRGSGHPAHLNYGDCFAYALAIATGESLLFKGDDFSETDIVPA